MYKLKHKFYNTIWIQIIFFLGIFTLLFLFFDFEHILFKGPFGVHFMRQTDSLSFASNYFNHGFHFLKPQLNNLANFEGRAACEFPITYYITALLYTVFGKQFFIQRFLHLIIIYIGVFYIFKLSYKILNDIIYAIIISLIVFTSAVFNYYSFNYLPDIPALGLAFIAWYFIIRSLDEENSKKHLILGMIFFTFSSLIKVTYLINPLSVIVLAIVSKIFYAKNPLIKNANKTIIYGFILTLAVSAWNLYMLYYNNINNSNAFNTKPLPIWALSKESIAVVWELFTNYWFSSYFYKSIFHFFYICFFFMIVFSKKVEKKTIQLLVILLLGNLSFFILFFSQFKDHDYYFLTFFPFIILVLIYSIKTFKVIISNQTLHLVTKLALTIIVLLGIRYSGNKIHERIINNSVDSKFRLGLLIQDNIDDIKKLNIAPEAKFIVSPENCSNGALLYLDKMGWSIRELEQVNNETINNYIKLGANYLLIASNEEFELFTNNYSKLIYKNEGLYIYNLSLIYDN
jgi:4-amino-4-deoxy-L-arabinose transferase-like glycosyltransferase